MINEVNSFARPGEIPMFQEPPPADDFAQNSDPAESASQPAKVPVVVWILGGLGCGCLGLIVAGIISAIALPILLSQSTSDMSKEAEAKTYLGALLRGQQAHFLENGTFATEINQLELGISAETEHYVYELVSESDGSRTFVYATPKEPTLSGFAGAVYAVEDAPLYSGLCQADERGQIPPEPPALDTDLAEPTVVCPPGSEPV
jgi:type II secretory pathway pseudopilin PulG